MKEKCDKDKTATCFIHTFYVYLSISNSKYGPISLLLLGMWTVQRVPVVEGNRSKTNGVVHIVNATLPENDGECSRS